MDEGRARFVFSQLNPQTIHAREERLGWRAQREESGYIVKIFLLRVVNRKLFDEARSIIYRFPIHTRE